MRVPNRQLIAGGLVLCGLGGFLVACKSATGSTGFDPIAPTNPRPAWVTKLEERVQPVPPESQPDGARLSTPTAWPPTASGVARGVPHGFATSKDAADAAAAKAAAGDAGAERSAAAEAGAPAAAPRDPRNVHEQLEGGVVVHVHNVESDAPVEQGQDPPSPLERLYAGDFATTSTKGLRQFGYEFFERDLGTGGPSSISEDHIVLPGDELRVVMTGTFKDHIFGTVEPDGTLVVPEAGSVIVAGRKLGELADLIKRQIEERAHRRDFNVDVSPGRLRGFRVHVVGEVESPGMVEVAGRATVLTALAAAKGPRKTGSLRAVEVRREGRRVAVIDLYEFLLTGETTGLEALRGDDVVYVPSIGPTLAVVGAVQRPGIYEVSRDATVREALRLAGGLTPFTFMPGAQIERTVEGRGRARVDVGLDEAGLETRMGNGEVLLVGAIDAERQPSVAVEGQVVRPGSYPYRERMTVGDLLRSADGLTIDAFMPQAFLSRQIGEPGNVTIVPEREAMQTSRRVLVIDLERALAGDREHDLELRPLDHLLVRARRDAAATPIVEVIGGVREPGTYELTAGLTVAQLVAMAGNVVPEAYYDEAELIRRAYDPSSRGLSVQRYRFDLGKALREGGDADPQLANGDQLVVRTLHSEQVRVRITGQVRFPGEYPFARGTRISDLIAAAGGVLPDADLRAARFTRDSVRELQQQRFESLRNTTEATFQRAFEQMVASGLPAESTASRIALDQTRQMLESMRGWQVEGRIVIPFTREDFPGSEHDLALESGDVLHVPPVQQTVSIIGHVFNPGAFVAERGLQVSDLVARSGGIGEDADAERIYVVRADGTVQGFSQTHYALSMSAPLYPGDVVLVPRAPMERTFGNQLTDVLYAGRRLAEMALLMANLQDVNSLQFTSLLQEPRLDGNIDALQKGLIPSPATSK
ncbi:MAG: SLBB domain-containing protein [Planctomycetes bacterium]|nr:SLBB domain-containing protein [Planctomycetota bacterium]